MIPVIDFEKRANEGTLMTSDEFDLLVTKKARTLVKQYGIKFNKDELIPSDEVADLVFQAGVDMLVDVGVFHLETQRVIKWTREEVETMITEYKQADNSISFGKGPDRHTIIPRVGNENRRITVWGAAAGAIPQDMVIPWVQMMAEEKSVDGLGIAGGVMSVDGIVPIAGAPSEIYCGLWETKAQKVAVEKAGRPGISLGLVPTVSTTAGTAAVFGEGLREPETSLVGIHVIPEQKIDWVRLNTSLFLESRGISPWSSAMTMVGGLCGGAEGTAVGLMANLLAQLSFGHGKWASVYAGDMTGHNSGRTAVLAFAGCMRAANRNLGVALGTTYCAGAPTYTLEEYLVRSAIVNIANTGSGAAYSWCAGVSPLEVRVSAAVMDAVLGKSREELNTILNTLSAYVEETCASGLTLMPQLDVVLPFTVKYDMETLKAKPGFIEACKNAVEIIKKAGLPVSESLIID